MGRRQGVTSEYLSWESGRNASSVVVVVVVGESNGSTTNGKRYLLKIQKPQDEREKDLSPHVHQ